MSGSKDRKKIETKALLRFLIPSTIGIFIFLLPVPFNGEIDLIINIIIQKTKELAGPALVPIVIFILGISAIFSTISFLKKDLFKGYWRSIFNVNLFQTLVRVSSFILAIMIYLKIGPQAIYSDDTGGLMLNSIVINLVPFFLWVRLFLPLLAEFGLMEFVGTLAQPIMRPFFKVPGRAAINTVAAWVGGSTMGIVLTNNEFEEGFYSKREAITIATGFSITSVAIVSLLSSFLDMTSYFLLIYITTIFVGFIINAIMARIPPISLKPDTYLQGAPKRDLDERVPQTHSSFSYAIENAVNRANEKKPDLLINSFKVIGDIWFTLEPIVLFIGVIATIIAKYTILFKVISLPLKYILSLLRVPEAAAAGEAIMLGFVDLFLPFIFGAAIGSVTTKFIIAVVCILQIIFITETVALLLKLKMGLKFKDLISIFVLRTLLALFIVRPIAFIIFKQ